MLDHPYRNVERLDSFLEYRVIACHISTLCCENRPKAPLPGTIETSQESSAESANDRTVAEFNS
mgnify:CR=1